jgi:hypothetical protein
MVEWRVRDTGPRITAKLLTGIEAVLIDRQRLMNRRPGLVKTDQLRNSSADVLNLCIGEASFAQSDSSGPETSQAERVVCAIPIGLVVARSWQSVSRRSTI